jgi:hypothetical protein
MTAALGQAKTVLARSRALLVEPKTELTRSLADAGGPREILSPYVLLLCAIGPVARLISDGVIGVYVPPTHVFGVTVPGSWSRSVLGGLIHLAVGYGVGLLAFLLLARLIELLAPRFSGLTDRPAAHRVAAAVLTPSYVAGALWIAGSIPHLQWLPYMGATAALAYGVALGTWALPLHLSVPADKAPGHVIAALGATVIVTLFADALVVEGLVRLAT